ncbi:hypothetical protein V496_07251 [Pseudogymnoascus sp. VKM F-4515 (FW-2607)]|nr:hypothetical protein V496_07251 [Pseudogymnoascus sp. VKM F-4515 (FW-2607)]
MSLLEGKRNPLRLGYHIVRNRGQSELSSDSAVRNQKEKDFLSADPWSRLDPDRLGTPALQKRLQDLLVDITRREFPKVQAQIVRRIATCRQRLDTLGVDRQSTDQQRRYLLDLSKDFQDITNSALDAYYSRNVAFSNTPALRLATLAVDRMDMFSKDVERVGHTIQFDVSDSEQQPHSREPESPDAELDAFSANDSGELIDAIQGDSETSDSHYPELSDLTLTDWSAPEPSEQNIMDWIRAEYLTARGFGLGTIGPSILPTIWQEQSKNWEGLATAYIGDIVYFVHEFMCKTLAHICVDERVRSSLWSLLQEPLLERYQKAVDHVKFILHVERFGTPLTTNHYFNENLQKCKTRRLEKVLTEHKEHNYTPDGRRRADMVVKVEQLKQSIAMDNTEHTVQDIHDILESYYKVARKRFVDTVCMQGSDFHLLTGADSPLRIFGTTFVSELSATQLDMVAGEEASTKQLRKSLTNEIFALEEGKKLLRL